MLIHGDLLTEQSRTEQNRTEQNRTEQNRTEQNRSVIGVNYLQYFYYIANINYISGSYLFVDISNQRSRTSHLTPSAFLYTPERAI